LTYAAAAAGKPQVNLTVAGFSNASLLKNKLTVSYGTGAAGSQAPGSPYMLITAS
jgi:hypothetical protein